MFSRQSWNGGGTRRMLLAASLMVLTFTQGSQVVDSIIAEKYPLASRKTLIQGTYRSGEAVSKQMWFEPGVKTRVLWRAKPARGNCVISLFSLFNADLLFSGIPENQKPPWSEITFETFGGSVNLTGYKQFQTNYLYQDDLTEPKTKRGKQELVNHFLEDENISNIFDGKLHTFYIAFQPYDPSTGKDARIFYRLDGKLIRVDRGGNANFLKPPLDIYAGVWITRTKSNWACTNAMDPQNRFNSRRPKQNRVVVRNIRVEDYRDGRWIRQRMWNFTSQRDLDEWNLLDWTFDGFDGAFDRSAVRVERNRMVLDLVKN